MLPDDGKWQLHQDGPSQTYEYLLKAILECLESLFYSISETELNHGAGWISRFQLLWDDIGFKSGKTIMWSDNENAYLKILLKRPKTRNGQNSEVSLEDLWQPRITPLEGGKYTLWLSVEHTEVIRTRPKGDSGQGNFKGLRKSWNDNKICL
jgi:hypothetical protein